jgi:hypothetical protein
MRAWYERWQAERTFRKMRHFYDLNRHKFDATENAYYVLSMDLVRSVMYKDYRKMSAR